MQRADSLEKTLMLGKTEDRKRKGNRGCYGWMASPTQWTWVSANSGRWWRTGKPGMLQSTGLQRVGHDLETEQKQPSLAKCQLALCSPFWIFPGLASWLKTCPTPGNHRYSPPLKNGWSSPLWAPEKIGRASCLQSWPEGFPLSSSPKSSNAWSSSRRGEVWGILCLGVRQTGYEWWLYIPAGWPRHAVSLQFLHL